MKILKKSGLIVLSALLVISISCNRGSNKKHDTGLNANTGSDTATIIFREYEHNFGKISEGEKVGCSFVFENRGTGPLVISSATTTCGCTVPKYDSKPIQPGGSGTIEVVFDSSGRSGKQTKTITVSSNATKPVVFLKITGEVITNSNN